MLSVACCRSGSYDFSSNSTPMEIDMLSQVFKEKIKGTDKPVWAVARSAGLHPTTLYKLLSGYEVARPGDRRVEAVAEVLGLDPSECFEQE